MSTVQTIELTANVPSVSDYLRLRKFAGLSPFSEVAARTGLAGTWFGVSATSNSKVVGMGRIVGDGGLFLQIVDIAVDPEYQGRGLGTRIMDALMGHLRENLPDGVYVSLLADVPANKLYEKFGFTNTAPATIGMATRIDGKQ